MSETNDADDERGPAGAPPLIPLSNAHRPHRRALVAMAITGALGLGAIGFVGGRWSSSSGSGTAAVHSPVTSDGGPAESANDTMPPRTAPVLAAGSPAMVPLTTPAVPAVAAAAAAGDAAGEAKSSAGGGAAGGYSNGAFQEQAGTLVGARTTSSGIALTGYLQTWPGSTDDPWGGQFPGWSAPAWCTPTGSLRISIVTADAVGLAGMSWFSEPRRGLDLTSFAAGYVESHPVFGLAAQVDPTTTGLTVTTADGRTDTAEPVGGLVLLAVDGPIAAEFTVVATHADGTTSTTTSAELTRQLTSADDMRACQPPPPALPPAGEQPTDPVAAAAGVRAALDTYATFGGAQAVDPSTYVDDTTGVAEAIEALRRASVAAAAGATSDNAPLTVAAPTDPTSAVGTSSGATPSGPAPDATSSSAAVPPDAGTGAKIVGPAPVSIGPIEVSIDELAFTSPTAAWFRYDLVSGQSTFIDRYGQALLVDGTWKLTRQTLCQDITLAGIECSPPVDQLLPPSAVDDPRYGGGGAGGQPEPAIAVAPVATATTIAG